MNCTWPLCLESSPRKIFSFILCQPYGFVWFILLYYLWPCSLCNTKATSKQTLLLHADGKKHRAKARAIHASKQQPVQPDKSATDAKVAVDTAPNDEVRDGKNGELPKLQESSKQNDSKPENEISSAKKKRNLDALEDDLVKKKRNDTLTDIGNGEVIQGEEAIRERKLKKRGMVEPNCTSAVKNRIKWKKFIKSALKSVSVLNFRMMSSHVFCLIYVWCYIDCICMLWA